MFGLRNKKIYLSVTLFKGPGIQHKFVITLYFLILYVWVAYKNSRFENPQHMFWLRNKKVNF